MSTNKLSHLKEGEKIYLEVTRELSPSDDDRGLMFRATSSYSTFVDDDDTFYTLEELKQLANDGMPKQGEMIEVIQRIPTPYKAGDKVLVLSNPSPSCIGSQYIDMMVGKVGIIKGIDGFNYSVYNYDKSDYFYFPPSCLAPAFDDEPTLSGKEAKVTIDGKEYSVTLKLI